MAMRRVILGTSVAVVICTTFSQVVAAPDNSSSCPPVTRAQVTHVGTDRYTLKVTAVNTCKCRIEFRACSLDKSKCKRGLIKAGQSRDFAVETKASDGKANFTWTCK